MFKESEHLKLLFISSKILSAQRESQVCVVSNYFPINRDSVVNELLQKTLPEVFCLTLHSLCLATQIGQTQALLSLLQNDQVQDSPSVEAECIKLMACRGLVEFPVFCWKYNKQHSFLLHGFKGDSKLYNFDQTLYFVLNAIIITVCMQKMDIKVMLFKQQ